MSAIDRVTVAWRRLLWRRPWIYWCIVATLVVAAAGSIQRRTQAIDRARDQWGSTQQVLVASTAAAAGDPIAAAVSDVPHAIVPERALDPHRAGVTHVARHAIAAGSILTDLDVGGGGATGPSALVPDGWLAVPIIESPQSGAAPGDRVVVATDGIALTDQALVVGHHDDVTLVAMPADVAPLVPAAAAAGAVALLLRP